MLKKRMDVVVSRYFLLFLHQIIESGRGAERRESGVEVIERLKIRVI